MQISPDTRDVVKICSTLQTFKSTSTLILLIYVLCYYIKVLYVKKYTFAGKSITLHFNIGWKITIYHVISHYVLCFPFFLGNL